MADLRQTLGEFTQIDGVTAALVVGRDGFVIEGVASDDIDLEALGAVTASSMGASEALSTDLNRGGLFGLMLEYENGPIVVSPVGREAMLVIVGNGAANLGRIRLEVKKRQQAIADSL
ncbi:MAG: roadblock/LC7 domain-containing protein [Armatimonadota bacterium]|nr:roadblock/LC7 domain-containing protein [Armatimonadota bacterium]MDR5696576.1 roadblock/LC7 domain-containing protein [Armatimonadota bacterium]